MAAVLGSLFVIGQPARAQLDVVHYIPPVYGAAFTASLNAVLFLSTPSVTPVNVTVQNGAGTTIWSGTVSNATPQTVNVVTHVLTLNSQLNQVLTNGLIVTADAPIYANVRHTAFNQADSLTAKGLAALGTSFRAGFVRENVTPVTNGRAGFIAVMATEDNTTVNFDDIKPGIVFYNTPTSGSPATSNPISVVLDANESYVIAVYGPAYAGTASFNDLNGTHITADKPIVVNTGSWLGAPGSSGGQDIGLDQTIPDSRLTGEYILMRGNGGTGVLETPIVIATVDNTNVTVNGNPTIRCTLDAGDYCFLDGYYSANGNMLVQATAPVYIYQTMAGAVNNQTVGMNFIPPVDTTSPNYVDNIPNVTYAGTATLNILARNGASVNINGAPIGVSANAVTGTAAWVTYRVTGLTGNVRVTSTDAIAVQFTNVSGAIGAAGYYSGLPLVYRDYGDLPAAYNLTASTDDGARHISTSLFLGATIDGETDGQPSTDAGRSATDGDDGTGVDDEDGIGVVGTWQEGANGGTIDAIVTGGNGCLSGWIDWNGDNDFNDTSEQVLAMVVVSPGTNRLSFTIPAGVLPSQDFYDLFSRFRLRPDSGIQGNCGDDTAIALTGLIVGGEVEDHYLRFSRPTGTGPGGVALSNGTTSLELWLQANSGTSSTTNGTPINAWADQSGYGHNASQATGSSQPTFQENVQNGQPVLRFDDTDDGVSVVDGLSLSAPYTVFTIFNTNSVLANRRAVQGRDADWLIGPYSNEIRHYAGSGWVATGFGLNLGQFYIATAGNNSAASTFWVNGTDQTTSAAPIGAPGRLGLGATGTAAEPLGGDLGEVIVYSTNLNSARRIIVENYLQAKYNDSTSDDVTITNDVYDGDTTANGNFDLNVAGIGQAADGDNWTAHSVGIIVQDVSFLQDNGDYLLFGHNVPLNDYTANDVPTTGDWDGIGDYRWLRHWYFDRTDAGNNSGAVDIIFDFSEGGMLSTPAGPASNYRLLRRASPSGQFEDITTACTDITSYYGDQVIFRSVDATCLGSNFTLGSIDGAVSPTAITTQNIASQISQPTYLVLILLLLVLLAITIKVVWRRIV
jgi:hypothetical protein